MTSASALLTGGVRRLGAVSPRAAAAVALRLFMHVGRPDRVQDADKPTMEAAIRSTVQVAGLGRRPVDVVVYEWGRGDRVVVLAHGWRGRASQLAALVRDLVFEGYRVVAFDAPAHGASGGRHTSLFDWIDVLRALQDRHGAFHAVVGHSFGALGVLVAVADGVRTERVITVAAPADADTLLTQFGAMLGYGERTADAVRRRFAERFLPPADDPLSRVSAIARPLPPGVRLWAVHDEGDRQVPFSEAARLAAADPGTSVIATRGLGHGRILRSDVFLDATLQALAEPAELAEPAPRARQNNRAESPPDGRLTAARPRDVVTI